MTSELPSTPASRPTRCADPDRPVFVPRWLRWRAG
jgi:hypothetical protein